MKTPSIWMVGFGMALATLVYSADKTAIENRVKVTFEAPEKFTDFNTSGFGSVSDRDLKYLTELFTKHIESEAKRCLGEGERLEIEFKDIDLAGRFEPEHGPNVQNVRIYRDITYPRIVFSFRVYSANGQIRAEGERKLTDMNYNMKIRMPTGDQEFRPDKDMLTDWMRSEMKQKKS